MRTFIFDETGAVIAPANDHETRGRSRKHNSTRAATGAERMAASRAPGKVQKLENVAVLDFETNPFDNQTRDTIIPFAACLWSKNFEPVVIWNEDFQGFIQELVEALEALDEPYTIYAHNGGKFDFMFLIHLMRGKVSFKGRGLMAAKLGIHELRDSLHLIPERLASYRKDDFDYSKLKPGVRHKHRDEIISYMVSDCQYLHEIVHAFLVEFGFKLSIGQAAMTELKKVHEVEKIGEQTDTMLREYFFGGRVECLAGKGHFVGDYKLYDVNSMYPDAMANAMHPVSASYTHRRRGGIKPNTVFLDITCDNFGALVKRGENNETSATVKRGRFKTTIHEFRAAVELGLIENIKFHGYIDCAKLGNFAEFINNLYQRKADLKDRLDALKKIDENSREYWECKTQYMFTKFLLNNAYGKFAQNPRKFKECYITDPGAPAPEGYEEQKLPKFRHELYDIWERPQWRRTYNNVGTAASITGAARAKLMRAIYSSVDPIYCDTDSLICKSFDGGELHPTNLGAWDLEAEFDEVMIAGKKLYACKTYGKNGQKEKVKIRSKGAPEGELKWDDFAKMLDDEIITVMSKGPTITKTGSQNYLKRSIRATAPTAKSPIRKLERLRA